ARESAQLAIALTSIRSTRCARESAELAIALTSTRATRCARESAELAIALKLSRVITARGRLALAAGAGARWASRVTGRGAGAMIGGLVAMTLDRSILRQLGTGRRTVVVTGTNGKSTTTRMTAAALRTLGGVASNAEGANMDAGLVAALAADPGAALAVLEVDEMHVPHVADAVEPAVVILLNLSRDQPDRAQAAGRSGRAPECGRRRQLRRRVDDVCRIRPHQRGLGGGRRQLGRRLGQLPAQRRGDRPRTGALGFHRRRLQTAQPAVVVRRRKALRPKWIGATDAAGATRRGEPGQRRPGGGGRRRTGCRSGRCGGR